MISPSQTIPAVPAPWSLEGNGYIMMFKFDREFVLENSGLSPALATSFRGGLGWVMLVDYTQSDAGPYRELLFIPGKFQWHSHHHYTITRIFVSTQNSVINGRRNWGIPKELADFAITRQDDHTERIQVSLGQHTVADFTLHSFGPALAVTSAILPAQRRTLVQPFEGQTFLTAPGGSGSIQPAQLTNVSIDGAHFPDIRYGRLIAAVRVRDFQMTFPEATIVKSEGHRAH